MKAAYRFVAPSTDNFNFALTAVNAHLYPLTDGKSHNILCIYVYDQEDSVVNFSC